MRDSEKKYRELVNTMPLSEFELDRKGNITFANQYLLQSFGYKAKDIKEGLSALDLIEPALVEKAKNHFPQVLRGKSIGSPEYNLQTQRWLDLPSDRKCTRDPGGGPGGGVARIPA